MEVYKQQNVKGDEQLDKDEMYAAMIKLIGLNLKNINN